MVISERLTDTQTKGARTILYNTCPFGNKYADIHNLLNCCACFEVLVASPIQFRLITQASIWSSAYSCLVNPVQVDNVGLSSGCLLPNTSHGANHPFPPTIQPTNPMCEPMHLWGRQHYWSYIVHGICTNPACSESIPRKPLTPHNHLIACAAQTCTIACHSQTSDESLIRTRRLGRSFPPAVNAILFLYFSLFFFK